jgi:parallel beta-helix repeat protein
MIKNNSISDNDFDGIWLWSSNNTLLDNRIVNNSADGIEILGDSNILVNNNLSQSTRGINLITGSRNTFVFNNITSNTEGIFVLGISISDSLFHHNNFMGNANNHAQDFHINTWNTTCEGNYWDNWTTPDADSNGIVDVPFIVTGSNIDYYPLTTPAVFRRPAAPANITAKLEGAFSENVNITWNLSADENLCYDRVKNYSIYYSSIYDSNGKDYQFLAEVPKGTNYYVHSNAGKGDPNTYFYMVQVNDLYTYSSRNETQVAKFNRDLDAGMHLISVPLILENESIGSVLQTVDFNIAWYYNSFDPPNPWKSYNPLKPVNDLTTVNRSMALWVEVLSDSNFTIAGIVPKSTNISLKKGWNLFGDPSFIKRNVSEALSTVAYERIEGYSPTPPQFLKIYNDNDPMKPGFGYWVKGSSDDVWVLTN